VAVLIIIAASVLTFDLLMPLGVAGGVPYIALVLAGYWLNDRRHIYTLAVIGSVLTMVGYIGSPDGGIPWVVLTNRALALFAIWTAAFLTYSYKKAERGERILSHAVEQSGDMVFITDLKGDIVYINTQFTTVTGYEKDEVLGQNPRLLKSGHTPSETYEHLWENLLAGKPWRGEIQDRCKDGSLYWAAARVTPIRDRDGQITHFLAMHEDITTRKAEHQLLITARVEAEMANRTKSEFMANMSHELRTPLNAIIGFSNLLKNKTVSGLLGDKQLEYVNDIHVSGEHLLELINDVLDVSVIEAQSLNLQEELIDPIKAARAALRIVAGRIDDGQLDLVESLDVPDVELYLDERRFKQILLNLLANAVKFTPDGGRVELSAQYQPGDEIRFSIKDTGIGMDDAELAKALTKFGQVESSLARRYEGTGLGLTLATGLAEALGGELALTSEKGVGTTATLTFSAKRIAHRPDQA
jgi:PAS domain S-box-containing protein